MGDSVALTGASGLLGQAFAQQLSGSGLQVLARGLLDPESPDALAAELGRLRPRWLINCAAHTDVEGAEDRPDLDERVNSRLPRLLGEVCRSLDIGLVHFSSTGCYGIGQAEPFDEDAPLKPTTVHHRHKAQGEEGIRSSGAKHLIIRTGWLFGGQPGQVKNFVWKRLLEASRSPRMTSDASQRGCPTLADDVARQVLFLMEQPVDGTFNVVANGCASRFEYVRAIVQASGLPCMVEPGPAFQRKAKVSFNECAKNTRLLALGLDRMPAWEGALTRYVHELMTGAAWSSR